MHPLALHAASVADPLYPVSPAATGQVFAVSVRNRLRQTETCGDSSQAGEGKFFSTVATTGFLF